MQQIEEIALRHAGRPTRHRHRRAVVRAQRLRLELRLDVRHPRTTSTSARDAGPVAATPSPASCASSSPRRSTTRSVAVFGPPPVRGVGRAGGFKLMVEDRGDLGPGRAAGADRRTWSRKGNEHAGPGRPVHRLPRQHAAALRRHRPRASAMTQGVALERRVRHAAGLPGLAVRQRLQPLRPHLAGDRPGRAAVPRPDRGRAAAARSATRAGEMVPLGSLADVTRGQRPAGADALQHVPGRRRSTAAPRPGVSSGEAIDLMRAAGRRASCRRRWRTSGPSMSYLELQAGNTAMIVFGFAVVLVFLVLAAQYESWSLPLAVILVVPMCLLERRSPACSIAEHGHQHLHADRLRRAGRPGEQERHPDRRVRQAAARRRASRAARRRWRRAGCGCGRS